MNPFDLSGPSFLAFYIGVAIIVVVVAKLAIDAAEGGAPPALPLGDPYQIAWLRGGTPEAARIAALALTDRGLLAVHGDNLVNFGSGQSFVRQPLESAVLARAARNPGQRRPLSSTIPRSSALARPIRCSWSNCN